MALRSSSTHWGWVTRALHWSIAAAVLGMLASGLYADGLDVRTVAGLDRFDAVIAIHKSFGLLILMMMVVRVLWRLFERTPKLPAMVPAWERIAARITQLLLYAGLYAMPISGYLMAAAEGEPVRFFGIALPRLASIPGRWAHVAHDTHHTVGYVLLALVALHGVGALKNHCIDRNDVLRNMLGLLPESGAAPRTVAPLDLARP